MLNDEVECINMSSYNYLGFSENKSSCYANVEDVVRKNGISYCSTRSECGSSSLHTHLEHLTAKFLNVEDSICFAMGFATNALNIPSLLGAGCLALSDQLNHASIILGLKLSGACVRKFKHNDMIELESLLRESILNGQRDGQPWRKIFIITEGIFSMEGTILNLPEIIRLKKKYKAYLFVDEAHSIGAIGKSGRGITDYFNIPSSEVDILMGTFTKTFASAGGYIAGSKALINRLRIHSQAHCYATSMTPAVCQQIIETMNLIMFSSDGDKRIKNLQENVKYFRRRLNEIGLYVMGDEDSPIVPVRTVNVSRGVAMVRKLIKRRIALCIICFPVVDILSTRIRFCMSASHTREQLDYVLNNLDELSEKLGMKK